MSQPPSIDVRYLVDVSSDTNGHDEAIAAVAELSFKHDAYFSILGDTQKIAACLANHPYEAEFVETVHCENAEAARRHITEAIREDPQSMLATSQLPANVSRALIDEKCLLPGVVAPALTSIVPVVKDEDEGEKDRYCTLLDIEGHPWPISNSAEVLIALAHPIVRWFAPEQRIHVGVLTAGEGTQPSAAQQQLLASLKHLDAQDHHSVGALSPAQLMLGAAHLALNVGEGGAMFVRTLEATFVAAEALVHRETQGVRGRLGLRIFRDRLEKLRDYGNIDSYGGSPLLGVRNPCVILRPDAGTRAWMNALRILNKMQESEVIEQQRAFLRELSEDEE